MAEEKKRLEKTFEELIQEWITETEKIIGLEVRPAFRGKTPVPSFWGGLYCDKKFIWDYCAALGDDNPIFTDPEYAAKTRYGCLLAPPGMLMAARYTVSHGAAESGDKEYPIANFFAGTEFMYYDVIRVGTRFKTELTLKELIQKKGSVGGRLLFVVTDGYYWNMRGDLLGKCKGHLIEIPMESRLWEKGEIGKEMLYDRGIYKYSKEELERIEQDMKNNEVRRGATPRYWEDVNVGDELPPVVKGPYTVQDEITASVHYNGPGYRCFEPCYKGIKATVTGYGGENRHPITGWPYDPGHEHEDATLCRFRGVPLPFDYGQQRVIWTSIAPTNWMGDDGFLRRFRSDCRKPNYYGDTVWYKPTVVKKFKVTEKGEAGVGGVPGEAEYAAVLIKIEGINQLGELCQPGFATVYLPSRELGPVQLPIPHPPKPTYEPFGSLRINEL